jgi:hypothetical protein
MPATQSDDLGAMLFDEGEHPHTISNRLPCVPPVFFADLFAG